MVNTKQRFQIGAIIILVSILLVSGIWLWQIWKRDYRHQNKVYSGAKLVSGTIVGKLKE